MAQKDPEGPEEDPPPLKLVDDNELSEELDDDNYLKAKHRVDTRHYVDRRQTADRRQTIRFEEDRRKYIRRTEDRAWRTT